MSRSDIKNISLLVLIGGIFLISVIALPVSSQGIVQPIERCTLRDTIQINIRTDGTPDNDITAVLQNSIVSSVPSDMATPAVAPFPTQVRDAASPSNIDGGSAATPLTTGVNGQTTALAKTWAIICLVNTVNTVVDWIFYILISIVLLFIVIAAFLWLSSGGDPSQQKKAGAMIIAAVVGLVIAVMARLIPGIVVGIFA